MSLFMSVFSLFVVRKEVKKEDAEEKNRSTVKKKYSETQMKGNSKLRLC